MEMKEEEEEDKKEKEEGEEEEEEEMEKALISLLIKALIPFMRLHPHELISKVSKTSHLLISSHWSL